MLLSTSASLRIDQTKNGEDVQIVSEEAARAVALGSARPSINDADGVVILLALRVDP